MSSLVELRWSAGAALAAVGDLTGRAELAVTDTGPASAIALVDAVLVPAGPRSVVAGAARQMAAADRDRVLVRVHLDVYGPTVATTLVCRACGERFDLDFRIDDLALHCAPGPSDGAIAVDGAMAWRIGDVEFRPVTGDDELAVLGEADGGQALLQRVIGPLVVAPGVDGLRATVGAALARLTPPVSAPIGARCPECGDSQTVEFDIQRFLLSRLLSERARLYRVIHLLASTYHWSRDAIVDLPRREREAYVEAITSARRSRVR